MNSTSVKTTSSALYEGHTFRLLDLPWELTLKIFKLAREPGVIHTCRSLYYHNDLPGFVAYTRVLLLLAYGPGDLTPEDFVGDGLQLFPVDHGEAWTRAVRKELQLSLATRSWLRATHLRWVHGSSWELEWGKKLPDRWRISHTNPPRFIIEQSDQRVVVGNVGNDESPDLRMYCAFASTRYIPDCLVAYRRRSGYSRATWETRELFLFQAYHRQTIHRPELKLQYRDTHTMPLGLRCNTALLADELRYAMEDDDFGSLLDWLRLNAACGSPIEITGDTLRACLESNLPALLGALFKFYRPWTRHPDVRTLANFALFSHAHLTALKREAQLMHYSDDSQMLKVIYRELKRLPDQETLMSIWSVS
jgi:hypothetical protein